MLKPWHYSSEDLSGRPTLCVGQAADLKLEERGFRWWVSRCGIEDGETHRVHVEVFQDGRWQDWEKYEPLA